MTLESRRLNARRKIWWVFFLLMLSTVACSASGLVGREEPTPEATRVVAPTFTPTPSSIQALVVVTPPRGNTPGVIIIPPGVDPSSVIPIPPTETPVPSPTPTETPTALPTDTPEPSATVDPNATPAVGPGLPPPTPADQPPADVMPTDTPPPSPLLLPTPTPSPTPAPTFTPTVTPTPFVLVTQGLVNLRTGPGVDYPLVAQLGPNIPVAVVGQNPQGDWLQICCVNGESVWVARNHVTVINDTQEVLLVLADAPPTPTPTATPTETPTITPTPTATPYPFQVIEGPLFFPTGNELLTIWVKVSAGGAPLGGYHLAVFFRNREDGSSFESRPNTKGEAPSTDYFEFNVPPGPASGNRVEYNYKYEFLPPDPRADNPNSTDTRLTLIDGYWRIYLTDGAGTQLSDAIEFNTLSGNNRREVYVAWGRTP